MFDVRGRAATELDLSTGDYQIARWKAGRVIIYAPLSLTIYRDRRRRQLKYFTRMACALRTRPWRAPSTLHFWRQLNESHWLFVECVWVVTSDNPNRGKWGKRKSSRIMLLHAWYQYIVCTNCTNEPESWTFILR